MPADVSVRLLRYFAVLADELNYRRAAERLFISQPALSAAIRQLEQTVGGRLFDRDTRSVRLTEVGRAWLPDVHAALDASDRAAEAIAALTGRAEVRIGYLIGTGADLLFQMLEHVEQEFPGIGITTTEYDFADPSAGLASGASDIAIVRPPLDVDGLQMAVLAEETWVACLPRAHPLAERESLVIGDLLDQPLVVAPSSAGVWRDYWMATDARGDEPAVVAAEAATYEAETTLVSRGVGISFTTSSMTRLYDRPGIRFVPITDRPTSYTALAWDPRALAPTAARLVQHMLAQVPTSDKA